MSYTPRVWNNNDIVKHTDLNRIEQGIANSEQIPQNSITLYVSAYSGDNTTGTGEADKPFKTLDKAIDKFPCSNDKNVEYILQVGPGEYPSLTLTSPKNIKMIISGNATVKGDILISCGKLSVVSSVEDASFSAFEGNLTMLGGDLNVAVPLSVVQSSPGEGIGIDCREGAHLAVQNEVTIQNFNTAIRCISSYLSLRNVQTESSITGVICECGLVQLGRESIQATTKFVAQHGGRIYVGAQAIGTSY